MLGWWGLAKDEELDEGANEEDNGQLPEKETLSE